MQHYVETSGHGPELPQTLTGVGKVGKVGDYFFGKSTGLIIGKAFWKASNFLTTKSKWVVGAILGGWWGKLSGKSNGKLYIGKILGSLETKNHSKHKSWEMGK